MGLDLKTLKTLSKLDADDVLEAVGLQRKSSTDWVAPALTALGVGLLVGTALGLMVATRPGQELREDLRQRLSGTDSDGSRTPVGSGAANREPVARGV